MKFVFRKATKKDIPTLGRMMREVWEAMEQKEWFAQYDAEKYITDLFNTRKGDVWQATDPITRQVAGIFIATYPGRGNENLGYDIGLSDPELSLVAHMDTIVVHLPGPRLATETDCISGTGFMLPRISVFHVYGSPGQ